MRTLELFAVMMIATACNADKTLELDDDVDDDGYITSEDCDDDDASVHPGAVEICDGIDNDCDTLIDDLDDNVDLTGETNYYEDSDGDGFGTLEGAPFCAQPPGTVEDNSDCDDLDKDVYPDAPEYCDGDDSDCDGDESVGIATHVDGEGVRTDLTDLLTGTAGSPVELEVDTEGTITFCDGTYYVGLDIVAPGDVTVTSLNGAAKTTLDGADIYGFLHTGDDGTSGLPQSHTLTLSDLRLHNAYGADSAIGSDNGNLVLENCLIKTPRADEYAAVGSMVGTVTLNDTDIDRPAADWGAVGGPYASIVANGGKLNDGDSHGFRTEDDRYGGGAIDLTGVTIDSMVGIGVHAIDGDIDLNTVEVWSTAGGGVRAEYGAVSVQESVFDSNGSVFDGDEDSAVYGGAISLIEGSADISGSTFENNTARAGGAVFGRDGHLAISSSTFDRNSAQQGGAVFATFGSMELVTAEFDKNDASIYGGAVGSHDATVTIDDSAFTSNMSTDDGGAVGLVSGDVTITDTTFTSNRAQVDGGALQILTGDAIITGSTFDQNQAVDDGGGLAVFWGDATITSTAITNNSGGVTDGGYGGGLFINGEGVRASITLTDCTVSGNEAHRGGGIAASSGADIDLVDSAVSENSATYGGGIYTRDYDLTCTSSSESSSHGIYGNDAAGGGGVYLYDYAFILGYIPTFSGTDCDMGTKRGGDENTPNDVRWLNGNSYTDLGDNADPWCTGGTCS